VLLPGIDSYFLCPDDASLVSIFEVKSTTELDGDMYFRYDHSLWWLLVAFRKDWKVHIIY